MAAFPRSVASFVVVFLAFAFVSCAPVEKAPVAAATDKEAEPVERIAPPEPSEWANGVLKLIEEKEFDLARRSLDAERNNAEKNEFEFGLLECELLFAEEKYEAVIAGILALKRKGLEVYETGKWPRKLLANSLNTMRESKHLARKVSFFEAFREGYKDDMPANWLTFTDANIFENYVAIYKSKDSTEAEKSGAKAKIDARKTALLSFEADVNPWDLRNMAMTLADLGEHEAAVTLAQKAYEDYRIYDIGRKTVETTEMNKGHEDEEWEAYISTFLDVLTYCYYKAGYYSPEKNIVAAAQNDLVSPVFEDVTEKSGLKGGRRIAIADFDNDGFEDVVLSGTLFRNKGDGTFVNVTESAGLIREDGKAGIAANGCIVADYDNDGLTDILGAGTKPSLWHNDGGWKFTNVTQGAGLAIELPSGPEGAAWGDFDGDGLVDFYLACYENPMPVGHRDYIFTNNGDGTFRDGSVEAGIVSTVACAKCAEVYAVDQPGEYVCPKCGEKRSVAAGDLKVYPRCGRGVNCCDFDLDGDLDIHVSNYRLNPNFLWVNDGKGHFTDKANEAGVIGIPVDTKDGDQVVTYYGHTIGSAWGDYDNDGDWDLANGNLAHPRYIWFSNKSRLLNNEDGKFTDVFAGSGIKYEETHSDVSFADYDNDGLLDMYFTSVYKERQNFLYRQAEPGRFEDVTWKSRTAQFNGWGHAWFDYDNDGDLDLIVAADGIHLFENKLNVEDTTWIRIKLVGSGKGGTNKSAIGAIVQLSVFGEHPAMRQVSGGRGTTSQDSPILHFGLPVKTRGVNITIRWTDGKEQLIRNLRTNELFVIEEKD